MARTRDERVRLKILFAVTELLETKSYDEVSIDEVARKSGVGKSTIYRWWESKAALTVDACYQMSFEELKFEETGDVAAEFRKQILALGKFLRSPKGDILIHLILGSRGEPLLKKSLWEQWTEPRMKWGLRQFELAQVKGLLRRRVDPRIALGALYGPLYTRIFMGAGAMSDQEIHLHLDLLLPAIFCLEADRR